MLGFGQTNLREYYNLNFDPNESILYGIGTSLLSKSTLSLLTVWDDRLNTGQVATHAVWHIVQNDRQRWPIDFSGKHGRATIFGEYVSDSALAVTCAT